MEEKATYGPHPRRVPRLEQELTPEGLRSVFCDCVDFKTRSIWVNADPARTLTLCYIEGMARNERVSDYILRPLAQDPALSSAGPEQMFAMMKSGALYNIAVQERTTTDEVAGDLVIGCTVLFFPGCSTVLSFFTGTEEKRSIGQPENEPSVKGARDSFVESLRTNPCICCRDFVITQD